MSDVDKSPVVRLQTSNVTEAELAADIRTRAAEAMLPLVAIMDEATRAGLSVQWDTVGPDQFGRNRVVGLRLVKIY